MIKPFLIALQLLTRLPIPNTGQASDWQIGQSSLYYPLVGLIIGGLLALAAWASAGSSDGVQAALLLIIWTLVTGALHLDGLADSADAWLGGYGDREKTLTIMKDPCAGPAGVTAILLVMITKYAALETLLAQTNYLALILIPALARSMLPLLLLSTRYVRSNGLGATIATNQPKDASRWVIISCVIFTVAAMGNAGLWLLMVLAAVFICLRSMMIKRIQGTTGDTMGAMIEISEAAALIALAAVLP
ncbi:Cobalamin synthase [hydrothermal vent metagenome]|uniref:Adenosylcobinamide-GDP ribazoletransferase n=1 Tax=hydrothermal vent metagenome TaxID=652676 RepID=A0A3B1B9M4_9ZZZZ